MKPQNLFLVGLMGAGKTTIGRVLARRLKLRFYDSDHEIERRCGVKVPLIFEIEGEAGFRAREQPLIAELCALQGIVLATGGGAVLDPESRKRLAEGGTVVYLNARPEDLYERVRHDRNRPLLATADPGGPELRGGLLVAKLEKGTYVYTGLAFFRQLPAGVPGAYRLFANLLALGKP